jgi:hypothetical protein
MPKLYCLDKVRISEHAVDRFRERTGCSSATSWRVAHFIADVVNESIVNDAIEPHIIAGQFLARFTVVDDPFVAVISHDLVYSDNVYVLTVLTPAQARKIHPSLYYWRRT